MRGGPSQTSPTSNPRAAAMPPEPVVPPPPEKPSELLAWAERYAVADCLDDVVPGGEDFNRDYQEWDWSDQRGEVLTYRKVLTGTKKAAGWGLYWDPTVDVRARLHAMAKVVAAHRRARAWLDAHGCDPTAEPLATLLVRLRAEKQALLSARVRPARPFANYLPTGVRLLPSPLPGLRYGERPVKDDDDDDWDERRPPIEVSLALLGWDDGPLRWTLHRPGTSHESRDVSADLREAAVDAMIDLLCDPRRADQHRELEEILLTPAWRFALGDLDRRLASFDPGRGGSDARATGHAGSTAPLTRVGFRLRPTENERLEIVPILQKRQQNGSFSKGSRYDWHKLPYRNDLTALDRRVYRAFDDRFARQSDWGFSQARLYGILRALIDHPAVFLEGQPRRRPAGHPPGPPAPALRRSAADGGLAPQFELLPAHTCCRPRSRQALRDEPPPHPPAPPGGRRPAGAAGAAVSRRRRRWCGRWRWRPAASRPRPTTRWRRGWSRCRRRWTSSSRRSGRAPSRPPTAALLARAASCWPRARVEVRLAVRPVKLGPVFAPGRRARRWCWRGRGATATARAAIASAERQAGTRWPSGWAWRRRRRSWSPGAGGCARAIRRCTWWRR